MSRPDNHRLHIDLRLSLSLSRHTRCELKLLTEFHGDVVRSQLRRNKRRVEQK